MGRWKNLGSLKSFLWHAPQLSGPSIYVFTSWVSSGLTSSHSLMAPIADDCDILCSLIWLEVVAFQSPSDCKEIKPVNPKGNQSWIFIRRTNAEFEAPILWPPDAKNWLIRKDPDAGQDWRREETGMTEDEIVGWHHWFDVLVFEQTPGVDDGQGSLSCCSPWGHKESDTTERLNWFHFSSWKGLRSRDGLGAANPSQDFLDSWAVLTLGMFLNSWKESLCVQLLKKKPKHPISFYQIRDPISETILGHCLIPELHCSGIKKKDQFLIVALIPVTASGSSWNLLLYGNEMPVREVCT